MRRSFGWWLTSLVVGLGVGACGAKKEPTATERVAQVLDKGPTAPAKPAAPKHVAPDPAAPVEAKPAAPVAKPVEAKPTEPVEKPVEPKPTAPVEKPVEATPTEPVEPKPTEPVEKPVEPKPIEKPVEPTGQVEPSGQAMFPISVNDAALAPAIEDRLPSERKTSFTIGSDAKVVAWFEFKNPGPKATVAFVWKKAGKETWRISIDVGSGKGWRTWAEKKIGKKDAGHWQVDVVDEGGHVYHTQAYDVTD